MRRDRLNLSWTKCMLYIIRKPIIFSTNRYQYHKWVWKCVYIAFRYAHNSFCIEIISIIEIYIFKSKCMLRKIEFFMHLIATKAIEIRLLKLLVIHIHYNMPPTCIIYSIWGSWKLILVINLKKFRINMKQDMQAMSMKNVPG